MDWKKNFNPRTLNEGWTLFETGQVRSLSQNRSLFQGLVMDPQNRSIQRVQARIEEGNIERLQCSCPASEHSLCPHEAAFLFSLENHLPSEPLKDSYYPDRIPFISSRSSSQPEPAGMETSSRQKKGLSLKREKAGSSQNPSMKSLEESLLEILKKHEQKQKEDLHPELEEMKRLWSHPHAEAEEDWITQAFPSQSSSPRTVRQDPFENTDPKMSGKEDIFPDPFASSPQSDSQFSGMFKPAVSKPDQSPEKPDLPGTQPQPVQTPDSFAAKGSMSRMIDGLTEEQMRRFLLQEARSDPKFRQRLELEFLKEEPQEMLNTWYSALDGIIFSHQDPTGAVLEKREEEFLNQLQSWLSRSLTLLMTHGYTAESFALIRYAFEALDSLHFQNPDQKGKRLFKTLEQSFLQSTSQASSELMDLMYAWLESELSRPAENSERLQVLLKILEEGFISEQYTDRKISLLESLLESEARKSRFSPSHAALRDQLIRDLFFLLEGSPSDSQQKTRFETLSKDSSLLQDLQIQKAEDLGDLETARILLHESLRSVSSGSLESAQRQRHLISLLLKEGKNQEALKQLQNLMSSNSHLVVSDLSLYRDLAGEEQFLGALKSLRFSVPALVLAETFERFDLDEQLMNLIEEQNDLLLLEKYEPRLRQKWEERIVSLWLREASGLADASSRNYSGILRALNRASATSKGKEQACALAKALKKKYPHRPALLNRLEEAGFLEEENFETSSS